MGELELARGDARACAIAAHTPCEVCEVFRASIAQRPPCIASCLYPCACTDASSFLWPIPDLRGLEGWSFILLLKLIERLLLRSRLTPFSTVRLPVQPLTRCLPDLSLPSPSHHVRTPQSCTDRLNLTHAAILQRPPQSYCLAPPSTHCTARRSPLLSVLDTAATPPSPNLCTTNLLLHSRC